jgi:hypothetical protein
MAQYDLILTQNVHATEAEYSEKIVNIAKGDLLTSDSSNVPVVFPAGTDGYILVRDDAETAGLKWINPGTINIVVNNQADNRVITATGSNNVLNAEAHLKFENYFLTISDTTINDEDAGIKIGTIKIQNRHIWENSGPDAYMPGIWINYKGYDGGTTEGRTLNIGNGRGEGVLVVGADYMGLGNKMFGCWGNAFFASGVEINSGTFVQQEGKKCNPILATTSRVISMSDYLILVASDNDLTMYLPSSPENGEMHWIKRAGNGVARIGGGGNQILCSSGFVTDYYISGSSGYLLVWSSTLYDPGNSITGAWAMFGE